MDFVWLVLPLSACAYLENSVPYLPIEISRMGSTLAGKTIWLLWFTLVFWSTLTKYVEKQREVPNHYWWLSFALASTILLDDVNYFVAHSVLAFLLMVIIGYKVTLDVSSRSTPTIDKNDDYPPSLHWLAMAVTIQIARGIVKFAAIDFYMAGTGGLIHPYIGDVIPGAPRAPYGFCGWKCPEYGLQETISNLKAYVEFGRIVMFDGPKRAEDHVMPIFCLTAVMQWIMFFCLYKAYYWSKFK